MQDHRALPGVLMIRLRVLLNLSAYRVFFQSRMPSVHPRNHGNFDGVHHWQHATQ